MAVYQLADRSFPTKKAAKDHFKAILARNPRDNQPIDDPGNHDVKTLITVGKHPDSSDKIGPGIAHVFIRRNDFGTRGFWLKRVDGTEIDFSYLTAIDGRPSRQKEVKAAMRREIEDQIAQFRRSVTASSCEICGKDFVSSGATHVDHAQPTFDCLAREFAETIGGWERIPVRCEGISGRYLGDPEHATGWREFHRSSARLRLTHSACNLSRPRTSDAT